MTSQNSSQKKNSEGFVEENMYGIINLMGH